MTDCSNNDRPLVHLAPDSAPIPVARPSTGAGRAPGAPELPPIVITSRDYRRLRSLLAMSGDRVDKGVLRFLARELDRAVVTPPEAISPDVVTMNSRVRFRRHSGLQLESRALVYEDEYAVFGGTVPVLTPLGVALLGLRAGSAMPYASHDGMRWLLSVEEVAYQPEAQGRHLRTTHRHWPGSSADRRQTDRNAPGPDREDDHRRVVPLRPKPKPRPVAPGQDDDPDPNRAA